MYGTVGGGGERPDETARNQELTESRGKISARRTHDPGPADGSKPGPALLLLQSSPPSDHKFA